MPSSHSNTVSGKPSKAGVVTLSRTYQYRIYPSKCQIEELQRRLRLLCEIYNAALEQRRTAYRLSGKTLTRFEQDKDLGSVRSSFPEFHWQGGAHLLRDPLKRLDFAYSVFFRRLKAGEKAGFPRFRSHRRYDSMTFPDECGWAFRDGRLRLREIGDVRIRLHRPVVGQIKTLTIKRTVNGWYASFSVLKTTLIPDRRHDPEVGIDLGISAFIATSDGVIVKGPQYFRRSEAKLSRVRRAAGRKRKGSNRRRKQFQLLARKHLKIARQRRDFHRKTAKSLTDWYGTIYAEDLNVAGMVKNHALSKSIADAGWKAFLSVLTSKAEDAGSMVVLVPSHNTSQLCSSCGALCPKGLEVRVHRCECGLVINRDVNAAINVKLRGRSDPSGTLAVTPGVELRSRKTSHSFGHMNRNSDLPPTHLNSVPQGAMLREVE